MKNPIMPFSVELSDYLSGKVTEGIIRRTFNDLKEYFTEKAVSESILSVGNPVLYEYWESEHPIANGDLNFGYTKIYPGTIGDECYMTRGHFHENDSAEIYVTLSGEGKLLLMDRSYEIELLDMVPGKVNYIPSQWAHRTVNTGNEPFIFISFWPGEVIHDYETIQKKGFAVIVRNENGIEIKRTTV